MWTEESVADFYEKHYRNIYRWEISNIKEIFDSNISNSYSFYRYIADRFGKNTSILDVGCGGGWRIYHLAKDQYNVKGIDLSYEYIEYGKKYYGLNLETASIEQEKASYDLIILSHLFEHIIDLASFLDTLKTKLNPNGVVYIELPGLKRTGYAYGDFIRAVQNAHTYYFSLTTLGNIMHQHGFELVEGDEVIQSLWEYTGKNSPIQNDYQNIKITLTQVAPLQKELRFVQNDLSAAQQRIACLEESADILNYSLIYCWCRFICNRVKRPFFRHILTGNIIGVIKTLKRKLGF